MSHWLEHELHDFGKLLGLPSLNWNRVQTAVLSFERSGTLSFERASEVVQMTLSRTYSHIAATQIAAALELCHWRNHHPFPIQCGLVGINRLVFVTQIRHEEFCVSNIQRALELLVALHEQVAGELINGKYSS